MIDVSFLALTVSWAAAIVVFFIHGRVNRDGASEYAVKIRDSLFKNFPRTVIVFILTQISWLAYFLIWTLSSFAIFPFETILLSGFGIVFAVGIAVLGAKASGINAKKLDEERVTRMVEDYQNLPCIREIQEARAAKPIESTAELGSTEDYITSLNRHDHVDLMVEEMVDLQLRPQCIDEWLWELFDRFEETSAGKPRVGLRWRRAYHDYEASRERLITTSDSVGQAFRDSLSRWAAN